jgi:hypothetical protein
MILLKIFEMCLKCYPYLPILKQRKTESLKKAQNDKIENVAGSM